jgi:putative tryptophan/tyrosine transport system substrate-binding protein
MRRRYFIAGLASTTAVWPLPANAQQPALPVVALVNLRSAEASVRNANFFRKGLDEAGYVEGQNVTVEYASQAAKAATTTIPIVFGVGDDPVRLGLVANLARPGGNRLAGWSV